MQKSDAIWARARANLRAHCPFRTDSFLLEHTERVARSAQLIAILPELAGKDIDELALLAAALYHDAGWAIQLSDETVKPSDMLTRPTNDVQRELAASLLETHLVDLLSEERLGRAAETIREMNSRSTRLAEAQILSEAENLDELGPLAFWQLVRRHMIEGRGIQAAINAWTRQQEYGYWSARINDSFRFQSVRRLAQGRLAALEQFVKSTASFHGLKDLEGEVSRFREVPAGFTSGEFVGV